MRNFLFAAVLCAMSFAQAQDINLGKKINGQETTTLSVRLMPDGGALIKYKPRTFEIKCSKYRKDLCGLEEIVSLIEIELPAAEVTVKSSDLAHFSLNDFKVKVQAVLNDGTVISIPSPAGSLSIFTQTSLHWVAQDTYEPQTITRISMQLWGNRADGLDPIVDNSQYESLFFAVDAYEAVTGSLF
jgi:hypothetical protein